MAPGRGILDHREDGATLVGQQRIADARRQSPDAGARMLHGHELAGVGLLKRPGVHDLLAMSVDDPNLLSLPQARRPALACGYLSTFENGHRRSTLPMRVTILVPIRNFRTA